MTNPMTAVEALQVYCGYAQVAKHLKLPCQAYMALSDSKFNDPQAGMETGVGAFLAALRRHQLRLRARACSTTSTASASRSSSSTTRSWRTRKRFVRPVEVQDDLPAAELHRRARARQAPADVRAHARALARGALPARADGRPHQLGPVGGAGLARLAAARATRSSTRRSRDYEVEPLPDGSCTGDPRHVRDARARKRTSRCPPSGERR